MGAAELLVVVVILAVFIVPTIYGAYRAFTSGHTGWGVAIIAGWVIGVGWLVGIVYLATAGRRTR